MIGNRIPALCLVLLGVSGACSGVGGTDTLEGDVSDNIAMDPGNPDSSVEAGMIDPGSKDVPGATDPGSEDPVLDDGAEPPLFAVNVKESGCSSEWAGIGVLRVKLEWKTPWPATCKIYFGLNEILYNGWYEVNYDPETQHAFEMQLTAGHFAKVPEDGDRVLFQVQAVGEPDMEGFSKVHEVPVDQAMHDCLYPYDPDCSDGDPILCRVGMPREGCGEDKVLAAQEGCWRCVFPGTCSCDDGSDAVCPMAPPECEDYLVLAVQQGCFACVAKWTCEEPEGG